MSVFCLLHYLFFSFMKINVWHSIEQCTIDASIDSKYGIVENKEMWTFTVIKHFCITLNWINCAVKLYSWPFSQGSMATDLRGGADFNSIFLHRFFLNLTVKKIRKLVHICRSYRENKSDTLFWDTVYKSIHYDIFNTTMEKLPLKVIYFSLPLFSCQNSKNEIP